ncbi:MAG: DNA-binding protein [Helicobacteraceae bacterium]|nr:DNA-binding protein [Helicobacteraceae bacterium]
MSRVTIAEASEHFKVSKEAIHNRVRRGTLKSITENGVKYIVLEEEKVTTTNSKLHEYLQSDNTSLKEKITALENENRDLRERNIKMLIDDKEKIEKIYKDKDEQLKNILQTISINLLPENAQVTQSVEAEIVDLSEKKQKPKKKKSKKKKSKKSKKKSKKEKK